MFGSVWLWTIQLSDSLNPLKSSMSAFIVSLGVEAVESRWRQCLVCMCVRLFVDRVASFTEWLRDGTGWEPVTHCEIWLVIGYYCTRSAHLQQSTSGSFTATGENIKRRESVQTDWLTERGKVPGIRAGQTGCRWVRGSSREFERSLLV